jgi:hypothetical protein
MLLVVIRVPPSNDAVSRAAQVTGLAPADVQRRLAGILPRVLSVDANADNLRQTGNKLTSLGFVTAVVDTAEVVGDHQRIVARSLSFGAGEIVVSQGTGSETRHGLPLSAIALLQRAVRTSSESKTTTTTERKFAVGRALATGGLAMTKKVDKTVTQTQQSREPFVLLQRNDGGREVILYEKRLDYRFLGPEMQPTSVGNLDRTLRKIQALVPSVPFDDRAQRPGFASGLPHVGVDPVDLALHMVRVARTLEASQQR